MMGEVLTQIRSSNLPNDAIRDLCNKAARNVAFIEALAKDVSNAENAIYMARSLRAETNETCGVAGTN